MVANHDTVARILGRPSYWETRALKLEQALAARDATIQAVREWNHNDGDTTRASLDTILTRHDDEALRAVKEGVWDEAVRTALAVLRASRGDAFNPGYDMAPVTNPHRPKDPTEDASSRVGSAAV